MLLHFNYWWLWWNHFGFFYKISSSWKNCENTSFASLWSKTPKRNGKEFQRLTLKHWNRENSKESESKRQSLSCVQLFVTPWTGACQDPLSMGFSRQEYWSGLPLSPPGCLPNPGMEPRSPALQADSLLSEPPGKPSSLFFVFFTILVKGVKKSW